MWLVEFFNSLRARYISRGRHQWQRGEDKMEIMHVYAEQVIAQLLNIGGMSQSCRICLVDAMNHHEGRARLFKIFGVCDMSDV